MSIPPPNPIEPQRPREKPMQVLCLGLSRSGTMSTWVALNQLGFRSYHAVELGLDNVNGSYRNWAEAVRAKYHGQGRPYQGKDFEKMLWKYEAITDAPCVLFVDELLDLFPDAKVVLQIREPDAWARSVQENFFYVLGGWRWKYLLMFDRDFSRHFHLIYSTALHHWCSGDIHNLDAYKRALLDHNAYVRKRVPKERLLEWSVTEGWEPLCKFLDKDVPDTPFPRVNEGEGLRKMLDMVFLQRMITVLPKAILTVTLPVALGFGAWMLYQKMIV